MSLRVSKNRNMRGLYYTFVVLVNITGIQLTATIKERDLYTSSEKAYTVSKNKHAIMCLTVYFLRECNSFSLNSE